MNSEIFFRRPVLTGACAGGILAFIAYLPSVASAPLPWYRVAAVFVIGWVTFWMMLAGVKRSARVTFVCGVCQRAMPEAPCPHERLMDIARALSAEESEGRQVLLRAIRRLSLEEAAHACIRQAASFTNAVGVTDEELHEAVRKHHHKER